MNRYKMIVVVMCLLVTFSIVVSAGENLSVLPKEIDGMKINEMMNHYLRQQVQLKFENWKGEYERRKKPEQID